MGLIDKGLFRSLADRLAYQAEELILAWIAAQTGGTNYYVRIHNGVGFPPGDPDVEEDLIPSANALDNDTASADLLRTKFTSVIQAQQNHVTNQGSTNLNVYLSGQNINVHENYSDSYAAVFGSQMQAINVFRKTPLLMAQFTPTGPNAGTFVDGSALGTGTGLFNASNNSAQQRVQVAAAGVTSGCTIFISGVGEGNAYKVATVTIAGPTTSGQQFQTVAADLFLDVQGVSMSGGGSGAQLNIYSVVERAVGP